MKSDLFHIDPSQLATISDLQLLARIVVEGFISGLHTSPHFGSSVEFAQYRPYVQGDDPRFVDWSLYARTDRLHTKQFQEETNLRCTILLDCSASMNFKSGAISKFHYARMLCACLVMLLFKQKDAAGLLAFQDDITTCIPPRMTARHLNRFLISLNDLEPSGQTNLAHALQKAGDMLPQRGMIIIISDFLQPLDETLPLLKLLHARRHDALIFSISDPIENDFQISRSATLIDSETGKEIFIAPEAVREQYIENRNRHFSRLREECLSSEIDFEEFTTSEPLDHVLSHFLRQRNRILMSRSTRRTRMAGGR